MSLCPTLRSAAAAFRAWAPSSAPCARLMHNRAASSKAASVAQAPAASDELSLLQGLLGLAGTDVAAIVKSQPQLLREKPSVVQERLAFLQSGLGISSSRLRSLLIEKPQLLGDLSVRELRSLAGLA